MSHDTTRREFLGTLAAFSLFPLESEKPDLILHNANIFTVDDADLVSGQTVVIQALAALLGGGKAGSYGYTANGATSVAPSPAPTPTASPSTTPTSSTKKKVKK